MPNQGISHYNSETDKTQIFKETKSQSGIYKWTLLELGKIYIGSAINLSNRLSNYYNKSYLNRYNSRIYNAINCHGYEAFSLTILEYLDIFNLSKEKAQILILEREQYYLDLIFLVNEPNIYNILMKAGSSLGYKYFPEILKI